MKYLKVFRNWRIVALTVFSIAALLLILGDGDNVAVIVFTKLVGFAIGYLVYRIGKDWKGRGMLDELDVFDED